MDLFLTALSTMIIYNKSEPTPEVSAREYLAKSQGVTWMRKWRSVPTFDFERFEVFFSAVSSGFTSGEGAPPELGSQKDAVLRCGLADEETFAAVVRADNDRVGPWKVDVLEAPSPQIGACIARILEGSPWDREFSPGIAVTLALRTTGAAVRSWQPPNPRAPICTRTYSYDFRGTPHDAQWTMPMDRYVSALSCPSTEPLTHIDMEIIDGVATVHTNPRVPCAEAKAEQMVPQILGVFDKPNVDPAYRSIRCAIVVPLSNL